VSNAESKIPTDKLQDGQMTQIEVHGVQVLLCRVAGQYYALADVCSHAKQALSEGKLRGYEISCPLHGARFDIRNGRCLGPPATQPIASYTIDIDSDAVIIVSTAPKKD
jgi:3-phenylpropionate/trans-cinnamate dioxygenase ferredoxin subunit